MRDDRYMTEHAPLFHDRESARASALATIEHGRAVLDDPDAFYTVDPGFYIRAAEWRLRWIDCAPEGANHLVAPMQDKRGVPMGGAVSENIGPCLALREARASHGLNPFSGRRERGASAARGAA